MIEATSNRVPVGLALIIMHDNRVLLGRRLKPPMTGSWQLPGGWVRVDEDVLQAVARLVSTFPAMQCDAPRFATYSDNRFAQGLHSVSLYFRLHCQNADDVDLTRNKHCSDWLWADWYDLPNTLFLPLSRLKASGFQPFSGQNGPLDGSP